MNKFTDWLILASPGDALVYGVGHLTWSRFEASRIGDPNGAELNGVADLAYQHAVNKRVHLVQRRLEKNTFEYIAVKCLQ